MPIHGSQVLVGIGIPHTDGEIIMTTTGEELVAVEGETNTSPVCPFMVARCSWVSTHTRVVIITTREELVAAEGETPHITSMPFH